MDGETGAWVWVVFEQALSNLPVVEIASKVKANKLGFIKGCCIVDRLFGLID